MPRYEEEAHARELLALLELRFARPSAPVALAMEGAGVHWHVDARAGARSCRVHTFHYNREGAEYYLVLSEGEGAPALAKGRTRSLDVVPHVLQAWLLDETPLHELYSRFPFIDRQKRALEALRGKVDVVLERLGSSRRCSFKREIGDFYTLTVEGDGRSCELEAPQPGSEARCTFSHLGTNLAVGATSDVDALATAVGQWLDSGARVDPLTREFSFVQGEPHASSYEQGRYAEWLWDFHIAHARRSQASGSWDPMVAHLPLLERMARHPTIRRFFVFTSHEVLCFSRCPVYPFSTAGLPAVIPDQRSRAPGAGSGLARYTVRASDRKLEGSAEEVLQFVEEILTAEGDTTFYGSVERRES
ncbi:DUF6193 family natural product biosynthesis protein [Pyxidicoccus sp. MSG2]|uniref:DUF6193 family natural product biosynthesis protein n=1 Tax=Pyxidicoccus sp. MSG2 TaxID=2996790 RepID=UPI00226E52FD|nr:DUF6193 family natural product biosynthesis protein [Pyxidicoccus sp. MSG2]MCY1020564.1 DUF6193 family natural product biosynthesis protein [Pyxidicoccus sp. MSG2]